VSGGDTSHGDKDIPFNVIDDIEMNVWELMLKSGFEVGE
jgi:hypothetical protein